MLKASLQLSQINAAVDCKSLFLSVLLLKPSALTTVFIGYSLIVGVVARASHTLACRGLASALRDRSRPLVEARCRANSPLMQNPDSPGDDEVDRDPRDIHRCLAQTNKPAD
jgi:hypothetical protein